MIDALRLQRAATQLNNSFIWEGGRQLSDEMMSVERQDFARCIELSVRDAVLGQVINESEVSEKELAKYCCDVADEMVNVMQDVSAYAAESHAGSLRNPHGTHIGRKASRARGSAEPTFVFGRHILLTNAILDLMISTIVAVIIAGADVATGGVTLASGLTVPLVGAVGTAVWEALRDFVTEGKQEPHEQCVYQTAAKHVDLDNGLKAGSFDVPHAQGWMRRSACSQQGSASGECVFNEDGECVFSTCVDKNDMRTILQSLCADGLLMHGVGDLDEYQIVSFVQEESHGLC